MPHLRSAPGARVRAAALVLALAVSIIPLASVSAAVTVSPATGGSAISADDFGTGNWTTLNGPSITEGAAGALASGSTTILNIPAGFEFNPSGFNVSSSGAGCDIAGTFAGTATTITYTVTTPSTVATCIITFVGLQVRPTNGSLTSGNITKTGTSAAPAGATNYGTLTKVDGAVNQIIWITQPPASTNGGATFGGTPTVLARDQYSNNVNGAPVLLAITPGTGPAGATLTCTTNPVTTAGGFASFPGCTIDKAGTYTLRASSNGKFADSGTFNITVGPIAALKFTSYPAANTPTLLSPQPTVAIVDAGGNTVTTATNVVTLATNLNPGTLTCTGGLSEAAVAGVAAFSGCTQTTAGSGYILTATSTTPSPSVTGPAFAVSPPVLAFIVGPGSATAGLAFPTNIQVAIQNGGVTLTSGISATVTLAIANNPSGGTLTCAGGTAVGTVAGVATFTGCSINNAGTGYTLIATASNVVPATSIGSATSAAFNVSTAAAAATLTVSASQSVILWGSGVHLTVHLSPLGGSRTVLLQAARDGVTFSTIATLTTDASGAAGFDYRPANNNYYRAMFAGASDLAAVTSANTRVVVRQIALLRPDTGGVVKKITRGTTIVFTTTLRPTRVDLPQGHVTWEIYRKVGSSWSRFFRETRAVDTAGKSTLTVDFNQVGSFYVRSIGDPTTFNANSAWSPPQRYDVH